MSSIWVRSKSIPRGPAAVLDALGLDEHPAGVLEPLTDEDWREALAYSDRSQLTLLLGSLDIRAFPEWVRERVRRNLLDNCRHEERIRDAYLEIAAALEAAGIEFVLLKGLDHGRDYVPDLRFRIQYDIDLYCETAGLDAARNHILRLGYAPAPGMERLPIDHLPTMVRYFNGWRWRGDYFDPQMPLAVDLHFRFWDRATERFDAPGVQDFWARRTSREIDGWSVPVLDAPDALGYAALHTLRHWLRGSLKAFHVYELAWFLRAHAGDDEFWSCWCGAHPPALRRIEALPFRLAHEWFGCALPAAVREEIERLPAEADAWFERFSASPVETLFRPNKAELWLHCLLLDSWRDRLAVARRRVLPATLPGPESAPPPDCSDTRAGASAKAAYAAQVARRAGYHARAFVEISRQALRWNSPFGRLGAEFWTFLASACLFNFGMFVFMLLYNLRVLDAGYGENALGWITSAMTVGSIAGTLPAGAVIERLRLRKALLACFTGVATLSAVRSLVMGLPALIGSAFLAGAFLSLWAVSIPPAVAQLTNERARPFGFSLVFASGIGMGVLGGLAGGHLAGALGKQAALLLGCISMALALVPAARLKGIGAAGSSRGRLEYPRNRFVLRFFAVLALWGLAVGSFNPFFNAYFSRHLHASTEWIGGVFSGSQLAQVAALLLSPLLLRAFGVVRGIASMQIAAGLALATLARGPGLWAAAVGYAAYMSFQYMSEPGLYTLLMGNVAREQQTGASSLNFLVVFSAQAVSAALAGGAVARFGYSPVMAAASALAVIAALLFVLLLGSSGGGRPVR